MKKKFLSLLFAAFFTFGKATDAFNNYSEHIAPDRLLLIFEPGTTSEQKAGIIQASHLVESYTHLPSPAVTICMTHNLQKAMDYFKAQSKIRFVSFFLTDGTHYAGVLNDFFVKITDKNFEPLLLNRFRELGISSFHADPYIPNLYRVTLPDKSMVNTIDWCRRFLDEGWCEYTCPNYLLNPIVASNDPYYNRQWAIENTGSVLQGHGTPDADMDVDSAWLMTTGNPNIKVGIIDSGVDTLNEDLIGNLLPGHDAVSDSTDGYPTPNFDEDGHGTCCAGIVGAIKDNNKLIAGIAPSCKLIPVRSFYYILLQGASGPLPYSTAAAFSDAIGWAWSVAKADILSNSWGLPPSLIGLLPGGLQPVNDAINQAHTNGRNGKGVAMFFSSGNDNDSTGPIWPASLSQTIAVNATNMCDKRKSPGDCSGENWGGDYGPGLDFSAPGVKITTTDMNGNYGFTTSNYTITFNGTSAACPNAAGVGALLLSLRPDLSAEDVRNIIARTADRVGGYAYDTTLYNGSWSKELGYGRVNANQALQYALYYSSVHEPATHPILSVYPNPSHGMITINCTPDCKNFDLYDMLGNKVKKVDLQNGIGTVDASSLPSGIYLISVHSTQGSATAKVLIAP